MLFAFAVMERNIEVIWYQTRTEIPLSVAFALLDDNSTSIEWPDLIVSSSNGRLERLRYVGHEEIRKIWTQCWQNLGFPSAQQLIDYAIKDPSGSLSRLQAILVGAIESALTEIKIATPEQREQWLKELSSLFSPSQSKWILLAGLSRLLRTFRQFAGSKDPNCRLPGGGEFLPGLLFRVYDRHLEATLREQVDEVVRTVNWSQDHHVRTDPNVNHLRERSRRNRESMRRTERPTEPYQLKDLIQHAYLELGRWASMLLPADSRRFEERVGVPRLLNSAV